MPTIVFGNPKGGSGKTTSALVFGMRVALQGVPVTFIDADPEKWITAWGKMPNRPDNIDIISEVSEDSIIDLIIDLDQEGRFVIVDLEGTASLMASNAVSLASLVVIPAQGTPMDAKGGAKIIKLLKGQGRIQGREIPHCVVFTRTNPAMTTRTLKNIESQYTSAGINVLATKLVERAAYRELTAFGGTLETLPKNQVSNIDKAIHNADQYSNEIIRALKSAIGGTLSETTVTQSVGTHENRSDVEITTALEEEAV